MPHHGTFTCSRRAHRGPHQARRPLDPEPCQRTGAEGTKQLGTEPWQSPAPLTPLESPNPVPCARSFVSPPPFRRGAECTVPCQPPTLQHRFALPQPLPAASPFSPVFPPGRAVPPGVHHHGGRQAHCGQLCEDAGRLGALRDNLGDAGRLAERSGAGRRVGKRQ